jgi:hypothetical protein
MRSCLVVALALCCAVEAYAQDVQTLARPVSLGLWLGGEARATHRLRRADNSRVMSLRAQRPARIDSSRAHGGDEARQHRNHDE